MSQQQHQQQQMISIPHLITLLNQSSNNPQTSQNEQIHSSSTKKRGGLRRDGFKRSSKRKTGLRCWYGTSYSKETFEVWKTHAVGIFLTYNRLESSFKDMHRNTEKSEKTISFRQRKRNCQEENV